MSPVSAGSNADAADVASTLVAFSCDGLDDNDDNDVDISVASLSSDGNSNLTTRSKTLSHLNMNMA